MGKFVDRSGIRYDKLVALYPSLSRAKDGSVMWVCQCDCGNICEVKGSNLASGHTKSCGCLSKDSCSKIGSRSYKKHGLCGQRIYNIYYDMKHRCYDSNHISYKNYGAKGIRICDEWLNDPKAFFNWAFDNGYNDKLTIDRIDNTHGYSPSNCRWVTYHEQALNKGNKRKL